MYLNLKPKLNFYSVLHSGLHRVVIYQSFSNDAGSPHNVICENDNWELNKLKLKLNF
jgi:hypothetical protein